MNEKDEGGPAFPTPSGRPGMTLRDYFAGEALNGLLASDPHGNLSLEVAADLSFKAADRMLERRER